MSTLPICCWKRYVLEKNKQFLQFNQNGRKSTYFSMLISVASIHYNTNAWIHIQPTRPTQRRKFRGLVTNRPQGTDRDQALGTPLTNLCLTLILAWISNHMLSTMLNEITHSFPHFDDCIFEFWEWISNFTPHVIMDVITYSFEWIQHISSPGYTRPYQKAIMEYSNH